MMQNVDVKEMEKFYRILEPLETNEVYVLLLILKKNNQRKIIDTVLIKNNTFDEFFNKVSVMFYKARRIPYDTEVLIDINKKNLAKGLLNGFWKIENRIRNNKDVRNFTTTLLKEIRFSPVTEYSMIKSNDILEELDPVYIVKHGNIYYNVFEQYVDKAITKPELPIPGIQNGSEIATVIRSRITFDKTDDQKIYIQ